MPSGGEGAGTVEKSTGAIAAAPFGSAAILPISWMYIKMLGEPGLKKSTQVGIRIESGRRTFSSRTVLYASVCFRYHLVAVCGLAVARTNKQCLSFVVVFVFVCFRGVPGLVSSRRA